MQALCPEGFPFSQLNTHLVNVDCKTSYPTFYYTSVYITPVRSFQMESISCLNDVWEERDTGSILMCRMLSKDTSVTIVVTSLE